MTVPAIVNSAEQQEESPVDLLERELLDDKYARHIVECAVIHRFAPKVYIREVHIPKGTVVLGHRHKAEHINILLKGEMVLSIDGVAAFVKAPYVFNSKAGERKAAIFYEDSIFHTIHPIDEENPNQLTEDQKKSLVDTIRPDVISESKYFKERKAIL